METREMTDATRRTTQTIHIFVEITKTDHRKIEFNDATVSGKEIKEAAGVPLENDLAVRRQGRLVLVTNDEIIEIKNGDHFVSLPAGTIS
jgi:hypothetical protein